ncbi:unnamed protein product [Adineta steineri]|uniref:Uncharacterized protein n=1 Tax=Adineta steineri TaxID=433720 RepID=A0A819E5U9_9BILA|nr:unnamed protein product [Adineta steineri]CAF1506920.1 unnamed protein product [Adineta steineri]CAF3689976.1 unnamed protein product [Adineta steineri]CAF3845200.1 unnamed protein product [Adineta steineri]
MNVPKHSTERRGSLMTRSTLCGVIKSLDKHCILDPNDVVIVSLCDITLWDGAHLDCPHIPQRFIVSKTELDNCDYFPIPFTIYYDDDEIDGNLCYGVRCDIFGKNHDLKYSSEGFINVLTEKNPKTNIHITIVPCKIPSTQK